MIKITDDWHYKIEDDQYILVHKYKKEKGVFGKVGVGSGEFVEKTEEVGYFMSLAGMLKRLSEILCKEYADAGEIKTIGEHIAELRRLRAELQEIVG